MKRFANIMEGITAHDFVLAIRGAAQGHTKCKEIREAVANRMELSQELFAAFKDGSYINKIEYRKKVKVNNNGKVRHIDWPTHTTRFYQYIALQKLIPIYESKDNYNGLNCKEGCGINAKDKRRSVLHRLKHIFYDRLDLNYGLVIDQRKCYEHMTPIIFRRMLRNMIDDKAFVDYCVSVVFVNGKLPIGTPTSPTAHHIIMLAFDYYIRQLTPHSVRYADDNFLAFATKEEAQRAKWRIQNYWWYELGVRAKTSTTRVVPLSQPLDFCGYIIHRGGGGHSKGWVGIRKSIMDSASRANNRNWPCFCGILASADCMKKMEIIEDKMKLSQLTERIKLERSLDAPHIPMKDICGKVVKIVDYDLRRSKDGKADWIKFLFAIPIEDGTILARESHGSFTYLIEYISECEAIYGGKQALLPLEDVEIEDQCGYIFKNSTNQIKTFNTN